MINYCMRNGSELRADIVFIVEVENMHNLHVHSIAARVVECTAIPPPRASINRRSIHFLRS
jgi:hypothetical protein